MTDNPHLQPHDLVGGAQPAPATDLKVDRQPADGHPARPPRHWLRRDDVLELIATPTDSAMFAQLATSHLHNDLDSDPWDQQI